MTPRIIHFIWLGGQPKPPIVARCLESWRRFCPGWEIREWNDAAIERIDNRYMREALRAKKWAFAADYVRLYALDRFGGFYLDTDLELFKPLDPFLANDFTTGFIDRAPNVYLNMCFLGAAPGNRFVRQMLDEYGRIPFVLPSGEYDQTPNVVRMARFFAAQGIDFTDCRKTVRLSPTEVIHPVEFFNSRAGYAFHHAAATWLDDWLRKTYLRIGPFRVVRFKRRKEATGNVTPLIAGERIVWTLRLGPRRKICLTRVARAAEGEAR